MVRIMLADDHEMIRRGIRHLIEEAHPDWQVCGEARTGREAVKLAARLRPDVAVLDLSMPQINGLEATRQIRRESPDTEVLVFTLHEGPDLLRDALLAGARGYLLKSDDASQLVAGIEAVARHKPFFSADVSAKMLDLVLSNEGVAMRGGSCDLGPLTVREREIVQHLAQGETNREIAAHLFISVKTVETHRATIMRKLGARSVVDLVHYAMRHQLVHLKGLGGPSPGSQTPV
jgi:DNA-binding NarL/FixJ family response regulator